MGLGGGDGLTFFQYGGTRVALTMLSVGRIFSIIPGYHVSYIIIPGYTVSYGYIQYSIYCTGMIQVNKSNSRTFFTFFNTQTHSKKNKK